MAFVISRLEYKNTLVFLFQSLTLCKNSLEFCLELLWLIFPTPVENEYHFLFICVDTEKNSNFFFFLDPDPHLAKSISLFVSRCELCVCVCAGTRVCVRVGTNLESPPIMGNLRYDWAPISNRFYLV